MPLIAIPNVSEGRDPGRIEGFRSVVEASGANVLDVHSDARHNRSVLTVTGAPSDLLEAMSALASAAAEIDLERHEGAHPRLGGLDVCPLVPYGEPMSAAVQLARDIGSEIAARTGLPVYLYGEAAISSRPGSVGAIPPDLPSIRRGGLSALSSRAASGMYPDFGPRTIDPRVGVVCVGARPTLIAFNIWLRTDVAVARSIAAMIRASSGGMPGVRALGLAMDEGTAQVSTNLVDPAGTGIDEVFGAVERAASSMDATVTGTELVGLVPERFMPGPDTRAARLLITPGRTLETALRSIGYEVTRPL